MSTQMKFHWEYIRECESAEEIHLPTIRIKTVNTNTAETEEVLYLQPFRGYSFKLVSRPSSRDVDTSYTGEVLYRDMPVSRIKHDMKADAYLCIVRKCISLGIVPPDLFGLGDDAMRFSSWIDECIEYLCNPLDWEGDYKREE